MVVKVYIKRTESVTDVEPYRHRLSEIKNLLSAIPGPHLCPYASLHQSDRFSALYLQRQYFYANLTDRITSRPFLSLPEKHWIAYQMLLGLEQCHSVSVCHGDIKSENILLTSWNWIVIADFAPYKPTFLPSDNPSDFSLYFDTGGKRKCCLAPERFVDSTVTKQLPLTPEMDVFSVGCVIVELFADGRPLFDYSSLLAYRKGMFDPGPQLTAITDPSLHDVVASMIALNPTDRPSAKDCLVNANFAKHFEQVLHPFFSLSMNMEIDERVHFIDAEYGRLKQQLLGEVNAPQALDNTEAADVSLKERRMSGNNTLGQAPLLSGGVVALLAEVQRLQLRHVPTACVGETQSSKSHVIKKESNYYDRLESRQPNDGLILLSVYLCTLLRGSKLQEHKARILWLLCDAGIYCDDETKLQRILPFFVAAISEPMAPVKCAALKGIVYMLHLIQTLPPSEGRMFTEYLLPSLSMLPMDPEISVQTEYASSIAPLAALATGFLNKVAAESPTFHFDEELSHLRVTVERVLHDMLVGPYIETRLALLPALGTLRAFLGRKDTADVLFPLLLTLFNSQSWQVRAELYRNLSSACPALGPEGVKTVVVSFLELMLGDTEPAVAVEACTFLHSACTLGLLDRKHILKVSEAVLTRELHQSQHAAVRAAAIVFLAAAGSKLSAADVYAFVLPVLEPSLMSRPLRYDDPEELTGFLKLASLLKPLGKEERKERSPPPIEDNSRASQSAILPNTAASYSIRLSELYIHPGSSYLSAALEEAASDENASAAKLYKSAHATLGSQEGTVSQLLLSRARRNVLQPLPTTSSEAVGSRLTASSSPLKSRPLTAGRVPEAMKAAVSAHLTESSSSPWYPRGILIAHLGEHKKAVTRLAGAGCKAFFVSSSADGTVKVWDCRRLENDVSFKSRLTYGGHNGVRVNAVTSCLDGTSIASAGADGKVHIWRVDCTLRAGGGSGIEKYTGIANVREFDHEGEQAVMDLSAWGRSLLVRSTQNGGVCALDLRTNGDAWQLRPPGSHGFIERFALDPSQSSQNWLVTGSSRGMLALWDVRFRLPVSQWRHPGSMPINTVAIAKAPPTRLDVRCESGGPLVYVAAGQHEVGLWDVACGKCIQVIRAIPSGAPEAARRQTPSALSPPPFAAIGSDVMGKAKMLGISELQSITGRPEGFRSLLPDAGGTLLTGGSDRAIRCWDTGRLQQSYVVCAPPYSSSLPHEMASAHDTVVEWPSFEYSQRTVNNVAVLEESCRLVKSSSLAAAQSSNPGDMESHQAKMAWAERASGAAHKASVTDLIRMDVPEPMLVSSGLDGAIKAWR